MYFGRLKKLVAPVFKVAGLLLDAADGDSTSIRNTGPPTQVPHRVRSESLSEHHDNLNVSHRLGLKLEQKSSAKPISFTQQFRISRHHIFTFSLPLTGTSISGENLNNFRTFRGIYYGDRGGTVVKVLCYKSEGRWFDPS